MLRLSLALLVICLFSSAYGQLIVYKDSKGQIMTKGERYGPGQLTATSHNELTYYGSPFLTYPIWQKGTFQLDKYGPELRAELAYNLMTNKSSAVFQAIL